MISRRKLLGLAAGAVVAPVLTVLPKPSLADEAITLLGKSFPEEFKYYPESMYWFEHPHGLRRRGRLEADLKFEDL